MNNIATEVFSKVDSYVIMFIYLFMILMYVSKYIKKDIKYNRVLLLATKTILCGALLVMFNMMISSYVTELHLNIYFITYSLAILILEIAALLVIVFYYEYVLEDKNNKTFVKICKAMLVFYVAILVINYFTHSVFSIDVEGKIIKGDLYILRFIGPKLLAIYAAMKFIFTYKNNRTKNKIFITQYLAISITASVIEMLTAWNTLFITFMMFVLGIILIYMKFEEQAIEQTTGLENMQCFMEFMKEKMKEKEEYIVVLLDLDGVNGINEKYNYSEGDISIRQTAQVAKSKIKAPNYIASSDSDEIIIYYDSLKENEVEEEMFKLSNEINALNINSTKPYSISFTHVMKKCTKEKYDHPNKIIQDLYYELSKIKIEKNEKV